MTELYTRKDLISGLLSTGKFRVVHLLNDSPSLQKAELLRLLKEVSTREPSYSSTNIDARNVKSPLDWCSQFARSLRTYECKSPQALAGFAMDIGKSLSVLSEGGDRQLSSHVAYKQIAKTLTKKFDELTNGSAKLLLCIRGVDTLPSEVRDWMSGPLNEAMRKSMAFKKTRFVFTSRQNNKELNDFFNQFGFEKVRSFQLENTFPPAKSLQIKNGIPSQQSTESIVTGDISQSKKLIKKDFSTNLKYTSMDNSIDQSALKKLISSYSTEELGYITLASYPRRTSRYSLEHFTDSRTAALAFNWLKRQKTLHKLHDSGDLILVDSIRSLVRAHHDKENPEIAQQWREISSVLDLFFEKFPVHEDHGIAINLQSLTIFNKKLLEKLFNNDELASIYQFIKRNEDSLIENEKNFVLSEDTKLVTRRYMEISDRSPIPGLLDRVREIWLEDNEHYSIKKAKLEKERQNLISEIEDTLGQVVQLNELKDKLLKDFKSPKRLKTSKEYSFTSSKALIFLGLATCGASVMFESLGSYHAACGLAVTLFGFFWPNVELKKATATDDGPKSNLAIETQQRSLKHRIDGLGNRTGVMKSNLDELEKQISKMGDTPPLPYLESAELPD